MAVSAYTAIWEASPSKGNARLVELALAEHVNEQRLQAGYAAEAWPSQSTLARMCKCSRSTIQRAIEELERLGRISDTGDRKTRGTVVYELHLAQNGSGQTDQPHFGSGQGPEDNDRTDSAHDLTHFGDDLTHFEQPPESRVTHKPEGNRKEEPDIETGSGAGAPDVHPRSGLSPLSPGSSGETPAQREAERRQDEVELERLEAQLGTSPFSEVTRRCIADLRDRLGLDPLGEAA